MLVNRGNESPLVSGHLGSEEPIVKPTKLRSVLIYYDTLTRKYSGFRFDNELF